MENEKWLIYANVLIQDLTAMKSIYDAISLDGMIKALKESPAVDAVEVVRCKDCRFYRKPFCILNDNKNGWLNNELPEHFCSHGERETDG